MAHHSCLSLLAVLQPGERKRPTWRRRGERVEGWRLLLVTARSITFMGVWRTRNTTLASRRVSRRSPRTGSSAGMAAVPPAVVTLLGAFTYSSSLAVAARRLPVVAPAPPRYPRSELGRRLCYERISAPHQRRAAAEALCGVEQVDDGCWHSVLGGVG
ncbi:hypothetical protein E2C01_066002 [Portunus trituberculatus]|uniref:Uncharacterized protein n=1 Tax=Portunus trituberculatus TaxID=210409 RepID=A0A5B7HP48_PORTR|nr:hypothetical protein [Portunus trituberculatus]